MKIGIFGPHGSGKSTLAYTLGSQAKLIGLDAKIINETARSCPFKLNQSFSKEACLWIYHTQIKKELEAKARKCSVTICDRTAIDSFCYAKAVLSEGEYNSLSSRLEAIDWLSTYSQLIYVKNDMDVISDAYRVDDLEYLKEVQDCFQEIFEYLVHTKKINIFAVTTSQIFEEQVSLYKIGSKLSVKYF